MNGNVVPLTRSALDRTITVTVFPDRFARTKRERRLSARDLPAKMANRTAPTKHGLPLLKLAAFGDEVTSKGCYRTNRNTLSIDGVEGDYDGEQIGVDEVIDRLKAAN